MKALLLLTTMIMSAAVFAQAKPLSKLNQLSWKHRVILVWQDNNSSDYQALFDQYKMQLDDRDIIWFVINQDKILTNYNGDISPSLLGNIRENYPVTPSTTFLIGKDGGVKSSRDYPVLEELFAEIDLMPMRKMEIRRKQQNSY